MNGSVEFSVLAFQRNRRVLSRRKVARASVSVLLVLLALVGSSCGGRSTHKQGKADPVNEAFQLAEAVAQRSAAPLEFPSSGDQDVADPALVADLYSRLLRRNQPLLGELAQALSRLDEAEVLSLFRRLGEAADVRLVVFRSLQYCTADTISGVLRCLGDLSHLSLEEIRAISVAVASRCSYGLPFQSIDYMTSYHDPSVRLNAILGLWGTDDPMRALQRLAELWQETSGGDRYAGNIRTTVRRLAALHSTATMNILLGGLVCDEKTLELVRSEAAIGRRFRDSMLGSADLRSP